MTDAERYQWLKRNLMLCLAAYTSPGSLEEATEATWRIKSFGVFKTDSGVRPTDLDAMVDAEIRKEREAGK